MKEQRNPGPIASDGSGDRGKINYSTCPFEQALMGRWTLYATRVAVQRVAFQQRNHADLVEVKSRQA